MLFGKKTTYVSEITQFIDELKTKNPKLEESQRAGRALLWDKQVDRKIWVEYRDGQVSQKPYVYQTNAD